MFSGIFEWVWDLGHLVFMGIFWVVIVLLLSGIVYAIAKTTSDTNRELLEHDDELTGV